ncbi:hypothetical protein QJS04_geneDACA002671 [Acorus gramineus]|uniref:Uncharacterized protein n=1 Tax=Acorus gramineus TaxID=55184 RepID=A0AAV9ARW3_ACOGR|nr:hypothetical protein QJS04_geneDACA002671 [Acorus gramineus]
MEDPSESFDQWRAMENTSDEQVLPHHQPSPKKNQDLRRVFSDITDESNEIMIKGRHSLSINPNEAERVECVCCGFIEDCTPAYIFNTRQAHCGEWVCGLCSEAVKEQMSRDSSRKITVGEALGLHMDFCKKFNKTTRVNPKLSLASTMRDIARRSIQYRQGQP